MPASAKSVAKPADPPTARPYGGLAMEERVAARRARFIKAGVELFGTQGFRGATVRGVCAAAGLTDRYFYESFPTLEALLAAVYHSLKDRFATRLTQESFTSEDWRGDAAAIERQVTAAYELWFDTVRDPRVARILLVEILGVSPEMDALYEESARAMAALTIAPLSATHPTLKLSKARRELLGRALVGAALQVAKMWMTGGYRLPRRDVVRTCVLVAMGTMGALTAESGMSNARAVP
ncbi:TetR/AcrR family transcriptional regulator [Scleromatobacter humisilvae]|uniref:TetR/AcrR family transcriptional regulator n=1 Tax=Scleromatobacter humisilvae TaxID=2897159 RepID=A0A9X2C0X0_9BURK|nr:TetR/AcrR family transcriptional regulator [Scleromatobacter humisilvae]MCK9686926.1 TetR/AcrR family transcriptional regulator [Scleromatobacter humisilvae]